MEPSSPKVKALEDAILALIKKSKLTASDTSKALLGALAEVMVLESKEDAQQQAIDDDVEMDDATLLQCGVEVLLMNLVDGSDSLNETVHTIIDERYCFEG